VRIRAALVAAVALSAVCLVLRGFEFAALNTRWDSHAYGSVVYLLLGLHTTLLGIDLIETAVLSALAFSSSLEQKHFTDIEDAALYQYFLSLSYVPVYALVFLWPRWL
jgi:heme/copper-type cytochrome/quinol oxidase subunit 3